DADTEKALGLVLVVLVLALALQLQAGVGADLVADALEGGGALRSQEQGGEFGPFLLCTVGRSTGRAGLE
ncbi:MAG TPA: hypothetical protein VMM77_12485, partial [Gemmatimonadaceae bacterium]|nr:hypothetical protein [Gemmatimonadaceae bacterium]